MKAQIIECIEPDCHALLETRNQRERCHACKVRDRYYSGTGHVYIAGKLNPYSDYVREWSGGSEMREAGYEDWAFALQDVPAYWLDANKATKKESFYFTYRQLHERGWTEARVRDWLGAPDAYGRNRRYRSVYDVRLWRRDRVLSTEEYFPDAVHQAS
jgi:hypothetical protein